MESETASAAPYSEKTGRLGCTGLPAASLVAITVILTALGLPLEGIGLLLITDRMLDMMCTATNVFGDSCSAVVIARSEGERLNL